MPREYGYVRPLLSNLASDHSAMVRENMVGPIIFPRVTVGKPAGEYATFGQEDAFKVPDVTMAGERSQAPEFATSGAKKNYATARYGLKGFINKDDLEFMDGPFRLWERRKTEMLTGKLELAQEKRIADKISELAGRSRTLRGVGTAEGNKWSGASDTAGGDPHAAITSAIEKLLYRPNLMVLPEAVFDKIEFHPRLLDKLGEANMIKKVDASTLGKLFRIDRVFIAKGKADFAKRDAEKSVTLSGIWGDNVVLAYTSEEWDSPCAGKTVSVNYPQADNNGFVVRSWDENDGGILGGEYVQVAHDTDELVVAPDLLYTLKGVI